ncbi:hypothetical protein BHE74_00039551 [Ensete ventricosum]|nr:hypothetical protein BHE74_00039551 [Ensete ventricosum]
MPRPTTSSTVINAPAPKKLTRDELRERSAKELCWHCDEPWSREHHCKKGRLLVIEPAEDEDNKTSEEALEPKEEAMEEESQPTDYAVHALAGYSNPQTMKVGGLLKEQPITVLIDTGSTNNFLICKLIRQVSHLKWKFKDDNSAQILPTNTPADEEAKVQLMIAWESYEDLKIQFSEFMDPQP